MEFFNNGVQHSWCCRSYIGCGDRFLSATCLGSYHKTTQHAIALTRSTFFTWCVHNIGKRDNMWTLLTSLYVSWQAFLFACSVGSRYKAGINKSAIEWQVPNKMLTFQTHKIIYHANCIQNRVNTVPLFIFFFFESPTGNRGLSRFTIDVFVSAFLRSRIRRFHLQFVGWNSDETSAKSVDEYIKKKNTESLHCAIRGKQNQGSRLAADCYPIIKICS